MSGETSAVSMAAPLSVRFAKKRSKAWPLKDSFERAR